MTKTYCDNCGAEINNGAKCFMVRLKISERRLPVDIKSEMTDVDDYSAPHICTMFCARAYIENQLNKIYVKE
jgi:hypothetical protein